MSESKVTTECSECGFVVDEPTDVTLHPPCPKCGSKKRTVKLTIKENLTLHDGLRGKLQNATLHSKKKLRKDLFVGDDLHHKLGKWYSKERLIDKDNNHYKEIITDLQTGEIIHYCEESLNEHIGHGSAKQRKSKI